MFAVRKMDHGPGHLSYEWVPEPQIKPGMVKIKVAYCGICGSDTHIYNGFESKYFPLPLPVTMGHEYSGEIVEVGEGVTHLKVGDRVTGRLVTGFCGNCVPCVSGNPGACVNGSATVGLNADGAMSEYFCIEAGCCYKLPDSISDEEGAMMEPACVAIHACMELINIQPHETVLIVGAGPIGLLSLMCVKACGAKAVMVDLSSAADRLKVAEELGADLVLENDKVNVPMEIRKFNGGQAADYAIDATGVSPCLDTCIGSTKKGGTIVEVGLCSEEGIVLKAFFLATILEQRLLCSYGHVGTTWGKAIRMVQNGQLNLKKLITHKFPMKDAETAFAFADPKKLKVLLHP